MKRVATYSRVSTDKQECENQLLQLRTFAASQGWEIVHEYIDQGIWEELPTGHSFKRCFQRPASASSTCFCFGAWTDCRAKGRWKPFSTSIDSAANRIPGFGCTKSGRQKHAKT